MKPQIQHIYLFNAGPQKSSLQTSSPAVERMLSQFCERVREKIGAGKTITIYPHRVVNAFWAIDIEGEVGQVHLLLHFSGLFRLPELYNPWSARLNIDIADHVDAYWFAMYLAKQLQLEMKMPLMLSTLDGDNPVNNLSETLNNGDAT